MAVVRVSWITTVEEYHTADIDAKVWAEMEEEGDTVNALGQFEDENTHISSALKDREVEDVEGEVEAL